MQTNVPLNTKQQRVLDTLRQSPEPLSAYTLLDRLRDSGFSAPTQVYRALDNLMKNGLVHRLETLNAYVSCSLGHQHGCTAFVICDRCGRINELIDSELGGWLDHLAQSRHFLLDSTTIEIRGMCSSCTGMAHDPGRVGHNAVNHPKRCTCEDGKGASE